MTTTTLLDILTGPIPYDSQMGVWAEKVNGKFTLQSPARVGQRCFENGGILDDFSYVWNCESISYYREDYTGGDESFNLEWAYEFIDNENTYQTVMG
jgi:hypothetical protein